MLRMGEILWFGSYVRVELIGWSREQVGIEWISFRTVRCGVGTGAVELEGSCVGLEYGSVK